MFNVQVHLAMKCDRVSYGAENSNRLYDYSPLHFISLVYQVYVIKEAKVYGVSLSQ